MPVDVRREEVDGMLIVGDMELLERAGAMPVTDHPVLDALSKLAMLGTPHSIATYLAERECHGEKGSAAFCPVARYVWKETLMAARIFTTTWVVPMASRVDGGPWGGVPPNVGQFVWDFDHGRFDGLVR